MTPISSPTSHLLPLQLRRQERIATPSPNLRHPHITRNTPHNAHPTLSCRQPRQTFANLLTNGVKYAPPGTAVTVTGTMLADCVTVAVEDRGRGIPAGDLPYVFDEFFQVPGRSEPGAGLGLAVARDLAIAHGGSHRCAEHSGTRDMFHGAAAAGGCGGWMRGRLTALDPVVERAATPSAAGADSRLPGLGGRFVCEVRGEAARRGWRDVELAGLVAATEDRTELWLITPAARRWRSPEVRRWHATRFLSCEQDVQSLVLTVAANRGRRVCLVAASGRGRRGDALLTRLQSAGATAGRIDAGPAAPLGMAWAIELMIGPIVTHDSLAALRDAMVAAPRCAWCGVPVLGSRCTRCAGESR